MNAPKGICIECGIKYAGWALEEETEKTCTYCGGKIEISKEEAHG